MSTRASRFRRAKWSGCCSLDKREKRGRRKMQPGWMTVAACDRCPNRDSSSFLVQCFFFPHSCWSSRRRATFSWGRLSCSITLSIWIPRKVRTVNGPSVLWCASGAPIWLKTVSKRDLAIVAAIDCAGSNSRKSSRYWIRGASPSQWSTHARKSMTPLKIFGAGLKPKARLGLWM